MKIKTAAVIKHFSTGAEAARFFGISRAAVSQWGDGPIPAQRALELAVAFPQKFGRKAKRRTPARKAPRR